MDVAVVGLGNVGLRVAYDLALQGYSVLGLDSRGSRVAIARRLGLEAKTIDALSDSIVYSKVNGASVVAVAMPSEIGSRLSTALAARGLRVVDVSLLHRPPAGEVRGLLLAEAGVSPGLSTLLAEAAIKSRGPGGHLAVAAGSVSEDSSAPLGHAATWSVIDFLKEYVEPGFIAYRGSVVEVDPLNPEAWLPVEWPGVGRLECFIGGGMKRFLARRSHRLSMGFECSLRRPGHLAAMRILRDLGLLSEEPVKASGCPVRPLDLLARLVEKKTGGYRDLALMQVEYSGPGGLEAWRLEVRWAGEWSATSIAVGGMQSAFVELIASGELDDVKGVVYPEDIAAMGLEHKLLGLAEKRGLSVSRSTPVLLPGAALKLEDLVKLKFGGQQDSP